MKLAVTDANIFIDLVKLGLTPFLFNINAEIYTTQEIIDQLNNTQAHQVKVFIDAGVLNVHLFSADEIQSILSLNAPRALEFEDKTVAFLAQKMNAAVLSGDGPLRKYCASLHLNVKGIIWLFDAFIEKALIDYETAIEKMNLLMSFNDRLPKAECLKRIEEWEKKL